MQSSNKQFPYQRTMVTVCGSEVKDRKYWKDKQYELIVKLHNERIELEKLQLEVDIFLTTIFDSRDHGIEHLYRDGMTQQEVADRLYMDRSTVSKVVDRYVA